MDFPDPSATIVPAPAAGRGETLTPEQNRQVLVATVGFYALAALVFLYLLLFTILPTRSKLAVLEQRRASQEAEVVNLQAKKNRALQELDSLQDPQYVKHLLRTRYGFRNPDEIRRRDRGTRGSR